MLFFKRKTYKEEKNEDKKELRFKIPVHLEEKIDEFLKSYEYYLNTKDKTFLKNYEKHLIEGKTTIIYDFPTAIDLKKFIEKMAIWYELKYPDNMVKEIVKSKEQVKMPSEIIVKEQEATKKGLSQPDLQYIEEKYQNFNNRSFLDNKILDCVMYQIICRGGKYIGPRRAFLFAKENNRSLEIPLIYGIDKSDPYLKDFIDEYIKLGGSRELRCYVNYFDNKIKGIKVEIVTIDEILSRWPKYVNGGIRLFDGYRGDPLWVNPDPNDIVYYDNFLNNQCTVPVVQTLQELKEELGLEKSPEQVEIDTDLRIQKKFPNI